MPSAISEIEQEVNSLIVAINRLAAAERQLTGGSTKNIAPSKQEWNLNQSTSTHNSGLNTSSGWQLSIPLAAAGIAAARKGAGSVSAATKGAIDAGYGALARFDAAKGFNSDFTPKPPLNENVGYGKDWLRQGVYSANRRAFEINTRIASSPNQIRTGLTPSAMEYTRMLYHQGLGNAPGGINGPASFHFKPTARNGGINFYGVDLFGTESPDIGFGDPLGINGKRSPKYQRPAPPWMRGRGQWNQKQRFANWMMGKREALSSLVEESGLGSRFGRKIAGMGAIYGMGRLAQRYYDYASAPVDVDKRAPEFWNQAIADTVQTAGQFLTAALIMKPLNVTYSAQALQSAQYARRAGAIRNVLGQAPKAATWLRAAGTRAAAAYLVAVGVNIVSKFFTYDQEMRDFRDATDDFRKDRTTGKIPIIQSQNMTSLFGGDIKERINKQMQYEYGANLEDYGIVRRVGNVLSFGWMKTQEEVIAEQVSKVRESIKKASSNFDKAQEWAAKKNFEKFSSQLAQANAEMKNLAHPAWKNPKRMFQNIQAARNAARNYGHGLYTRGRERVGD